MGKTGKNKAKAARRKAAREDKQRHNPVSEDLYRRARQMYRAGDPAAARPLVQQAAELGNESELAAVDPTGSGGPPLPEGQADAAAPANGEKGKGERKRGGTRCHRV